MGGRGASSGRSGGGAAYERIPIPVLWGSGTKEEKRQVRETVTRFINEAKVGNVYKVGTGIGSSGGDFTVVSHRGGLGIKAVGSNRQPIKLTRSNVMQYIKNGATLIRRGKK